MMRLNQCSTSCRATLLSFTFPTPHRQIRCFYAKPRFDFGEIRNPDDAVALFNKMVRSDPRPSVVDYTKLLSAVVRIKRYSVALSLFDEMLHRKLPVNEYTLSILVNCFCLLNRVDYGFAILGSFLKRGYKPNIVRHVVRL